MRKLCFLLKFSMDNLRKNSSLFLPYILSNSYIIATLYIMKAIEYNPAVRESPFGEVMERTMYFGIIVIAFFALLFNIYSSSLIIKKRKKEFGIYSVLGMNKGNISLLLFIENFIAYFFAFILGVISGLVFNKLLSIFVLKMLDISIDIGFFISFRAMGYSLIVGSSILILTLILSMGKVYVANPMALKNSDKFSEKEPKANGFIALVGCITMIGGYYIALAEKEPGKVLTMFFYAIMLVIIGTYLIFISTIPRLLKILKKNKKFYYKPNNFISLSSMIYRIRRNSIGLASICILSTMTLVMISNTLTLVNSLDYGIEQNSPYQLNFSIGIVNTNDSTQKIVESGVFNKIIENRLTMHTDSDYKGYHISQLSEKIYENANSDKNDFKSKMTTALKEADVKEILKNKNISDLKKGEALFVSEGKNNVPEEIEFFENTFKIKKILYYENNMNKIFIPEDFIHRSGQSIIILNNDDFYTLSRNVRKDNKDNAQRRFIYNLGYNLSSLDSENINLDKLQINYIDEFDSIRTDDNKPLDYSEIRYNNRDKYKKMVTSSNGIVLFYTLFIGTIFILGTVIIIYYKQLSEGYEDRKSFRIMKKVGITPDLVKASVRRQVLLVFFMPLLLSGLHLVFSYPMTHKILSFMGLYSIEYIHFRNTFLVFSLFSILYATIYFITSRAYYRIVK